MHIIKLLSVFAGALTLLFSSDGLSQKKVSEACGENEPARELARLIIEDKAQQRGNLTCHRRLSELAHQKAKRMQEFGLIQHNLGGSPNAHLINGGYTLPEYYGTNFHANQVEAVAGGFETAAEVWIAFKESQAHRSHLLGEHAFYREQDEIGVGYVREWFSPHVEYWVVYIAKRAPIESKGSRRSNDQDLPNKSNLVIRKSKNSQ